jgi:hypothetical protein
MEFHEHQVFINLLSPTEKAGLTDCFAFSANFHFGPETQQVVLPRGEALNEDQRLGRSVGTGGVDGQFLWAG